MMHRELLEWMLEGEPGLSSKAMVRTVLAGQSVNSADHPRDVWDFRRCVLLLERVPDVRPALKLLATESAPWSGLVAAWDELEESLREEWGDLSTHAPLKRPSATGRMFAAALGNV